jgi:hypothetical protein
MRWPWKRRRQTVRQHLHQVNDERLEINIDRLENALEKDQITLAEYNQLRAWAEMVHNNEAMRIENDHRTVR